MLMRDYVPSNCGTGPFNALTNQVVDMLFSELPPGTLVDVSDHVEMVGSSKLTFLQKPGAEALIAAILEKGQKLPLFHTLRVVPQQYALHQWAQQDRCGIEVAAKPGRSNHEGANAIDVAKNHINSWKAVLNQHGWIQNVPNDRPHFEFTGDHDSGFIKKGVRAFQKLWNVHNPNDRISESGAYGPETEKRLKASPIAGF